MSAVRRIPTPHSYSSAVAAGAFVFLGLHRGSGEDFSAQLDDALRAIAETLDEFGLSLGDLLQVHVWLKYIQDLPAMEERFLDYFEEGAFPARMTSTTEFIEADCLLMIDGVAYRGDAAQSG